jgi:L-asparaginase/Glu-tRNA(Gln) amidotransferase subunit D
VVFGGRVLNAFDAYKHSTDDLDAFRSSSVKGDLGVVDSANSKFTIYDDRYYLPQQKRAWLKKLSLCHNHEHTFCDYDHDNNVLSLDMPIGNDTRQIELLLRTPQIKGLVVKIPGTGGIDQGAASRLSDAAKYKDQNGKEYYKPVVIVTRCAQGATDLSVYASSAGVETQKAIISAGRLPAESALLLLQWGLGGTSCIEHIRKLFENPSNPICFGHIDRRLIFDRSGEIREPWNRNPFHRKMIFYKYAAPNDPSFRTYD